MKDNIVKIYSRKVSIKKEIDNLRSNNLNNTGLIKSKNVNNIPIDNFQENLFNKQAKLKLHKNFSISNTNENNKNSLLNYAKNEKFKKLEISTVFLNNINKKVDNSTLHAYTSKNIANARKSPGRIGLLKFKSPGKPNKSFINNDDNNKDNKSKHSDITITNVKYFGVNYNNISISNNGNKTINEIESNDFKKPKRFSAGLVDESIKMEDNINYPSNKPDIYSGSICVENKKNDARFYKEIKIDKSNESFNVNKNTSSNIVPILNINNFNTNEIKFNKNETKSIKFFFI